LSFVQTPDLFQVGDTADFNIDVSDHTDVTFECLFQGDVWESCVFPFALTDLGEAVYSFKIRAIDAAGNVSEVLSYTWEQNNRPETSFSQTLPDSVTLVESAFSFQASEQGASFRCQLDEEDPFDCTSPYVWSNLSNGQHQFSVFAIDSYGAEDLTPALQSFFVELCDNGVLDLGEVCDYDVSCHDAYPQTYASGTAFCETSCSEVDLSSCILLPFTLTNDSILLIDSIGTVNQMEEMQIEAGGKTEIAVFYHGGARAKYVDITNPEAPQLENLFDYAGGMTFVWATEEQAHGRNDLIFSSTSGQAEGNYAFTKVRTLSTTPTSSSFGQIVQGHQAGVMGQYFNAGTLDFIFLASKKVHAFDGTNVELVQHEEGMTAVAIANILTPNDDVNEVVVFSDVTKRLNFYQYSLAGTQHIFAQTLNQDTTIQTLATGDLNGDELVDIIAASNEDGIFIFYNVEGTHFDIDTVSQVNEARHIEIFDLDLDGDLDIGYWSPSTESAYWTENLGDANWQTHTLRSFSNMSDALFVDLDGDGDQDLVTSHVTGTLFQLENNSDLIPGD
jgi:hypothetical protein